MNKLKSRKSWGFWKRSKDIWNYDPADYDFNLNMWSSTSAEDVRASIKRLNKIKLSNTSNEILENVLIFFLPARRNARKRICWA